MNFLDKHDHLELLHHFVHLSSTKDDLFTTPVVNISSNIVWEPGLIHLIVLVKLRGEHIITLMIILFWEMLLHAYVPLYI